MHFMKYLRLQHELTVLRQQLCESRSLVHSLQCELQVYRKKGRVTTNAPTGKNQHTVACSDQWAALTRCSEEKHPSIHPFVFTEFRDIVVLE